MGDMGMSEKPYSDATAEAMDEEAWTIVDEAYARTVALIREKQHEVETLANLLLEKETITNDDVVDTIGERPFKGHSVYDEIVSQRKTNKAEKEAKEEQEEEEEVKEEEKDQDECGLPP